MKILIQIIGFVIFLSGISLIVKPSFILNWMENNITQKSMYGFAIGVRLLFGTILLVVASQSRFPLALRIFGVVSILAAIFFLFLGHQGFVNLLTTMMPTIKSFGWLSGLVGIGLGGLLVYSFWKTEERLV